MQISKDARKNVKDLVFPRSSSSLLCCVFSTAAVTEARNTSDEGKSNRLYACRVPRVHLAQPQASSKPNVAARAER